MKSLRSALRFVSALVFLPPLLTGLSSAAIVDTITFGDPASERAHSLRADQTRVIQGGLGEPARVAQLVSDPAIGRTGDLTFTVKVDPLAQNYFTLKFWGSDHTGLSLVDIDGRQIGFRANSDYEPINNRNGRALPGRFYYGTILLPLDRTRGKDTVELTVRTYLVGNQDTSRGYYRGYVHTTARLDVSDEKQGQKLAAPASDLLAPDRPESEKRALLGRFRDEQIADFQKASERLDRDPAAKLSIARYQDDLRYYAQSIAQPWSPAITPAEKRRALERVFQSIDNHVKDYYADTRLVTRGGHQGDWGGYYGALGEALYIVDPLIRDASLYGTDAFNRFLDQSFVTNTQAGENSLAGVDWTGGELTRREAWERVLKANFDFARSRLSYIYNQVLYTYEGAWEAHEGLRVIGSRFFEGKPRSHQILREALGISPFLGEEILVGPDGGDLDLYHSLFKHDREAQFTDDYLRIVAKGLAQSKLDAEGRVVRRLPYGRHYTGISEAGLTRENGYVGNYGETPNYLPEHFYRTLNQPGDEALNDDLLKLALRNLHARGFTRYTSLDDNGHRIMRMQQVLDERNPGYPGMPAYAVRVSTGRALLFASLEKYMADHPERYQGPAWADTWRYAAEAVGFAQQQLADNQVFSNRSAVGGILSAKKYDYRLPETYDYITRDRAAYPRFNHVEAGLVHPLTDFDYYAPGELDRLRINPADYARFAWVDLDNMMVVLRDGPVALSGVFNLRNRGFTGSGRLHVVTPQYDHLTQIATRARFQYRDYYLRLNDYNLDYMVGNRFADGPHPQALVGEICPVTYQPGVGTVVRDNFEFDHPYSGYPDYLEARYGAYLFVFNTTRAVYGNEQDFEVQLPSDHVSATVLDLVSGRELSTNSGKLTLSPKTAMVFKLDTANDPADVPDAVNFVAVLPGNRLATLTWKTAAGAATYSIKRAAAEAGPYETIATGIRGNVYTDYALSTGETYFYKVAAVNATGVVGWDSYRARLDLVAPASLADVASPWRDDRIGTPTTGSATVDPDVITVRDGDGAGLGAGDDNKIATRVINDAFHYVSRPAAGSFALQTKLTKADGKLAGLMLRDQLQPNARYFYFGADENGRLYLQHRTRDTRHQVDLKVISPLRVELTDYTVTSHPWLKLTRDAFNHEVRAYASTDGVTWAEVGSLCTPFPYALHAGVAATTEARFDATQLIPVNNR